MTKPPKTSEWGEAPQTPPNYAEWSSLRPEEQQKTYEELMSWAGSRASQCHPWSMARVLNFLADLYESAHVLDQHRSSYILYELITKRGTEATSRHFYTDKSDFTNRIVLFQEGRIPRRAIELALYGEVSLAEDTAFPGTNAYALYTRAGLWVIKALVTAGYDELFKEDAIMKRMDEIKKLNNALCHEIYIAFTFNKARRLRGHVTRRHEFGDPTPQRAAMIHVLPVKKPQEP